MKYVRNWGRLGMMFEWKRYLISDIGRVVTGKTPKTANSEYYGGDIPFLTPSDDMSVKYVLSTSKTITEVGKNTVKNAVIPKNSICVSCIGSDLGKVVVTTRETVTNQQINSVIVNTELFDVDFVYYAMIILGKVLNYHSKTSTAVPIVNKSTFSQYEILCPELPEQKRVAKILSEIDNKITINTAINENLEQQAQAIFKSWFVDFEPFGGVMPDYWQNISVYDLANYINGAAFKKAEYGNFGLPIIKIAELKSGITDSTQFCCVSKESKYYIDDKDILFSWSGNPDTSIDTFLWSRGRAILNQHTFRVVSKFNAPAFTYFLLKYLKPQFAHIASNKQTTGLGHVTVADLKRLKFCANEAVIMDFEILTAPIFETIFSINKENQHLAVLRDTLLPKLMNGEIDVSEVKF